MTALATSGFVISDLSFSAIPNLLIVRYSRKKGLCHKRLKPARET